MISTQELAAHTLCDSLFRLSVLNRSEKAMDVLRVHHASLLEAIPVSEEERQMARIIEMVMELIPQS